MAQQSTSRLGKAQLGPHAFEARMPARIKRTLDSDGKDNDMRDVVPKLHELLLTKHVQSAYLCYNQVVQIHRLPREGNHFCGYRNLQMLCLALGSTGINAQLDARLGIAELQLLIESAWQSGYNAQSLAETGGIVGTRKYIGSPEVEAVLQSLDIPYTGKAFNGKHAARDLLDFVSMYFCSSVDPDVTGEVRTTPLMPLFLQRPGHSMTIVGIAVFVNGARKLLVFDPGVPRGIGLHADLRSRMLKHITNALDLAIYCRSERQLSRYSEFEIVAAARPARTPA